VLRPLPARILANLQAPPLSALSGGASAGPALKTRRLPLSPTAAITTA